MIVLNLACRAGHQFEGWFASRDAFDEQIKQGQVNCSYCNTCEVAALPSGPRVLRGAPQTSGPVVPAASAMSEELGRLIRALADAARQADDVGARFAVEARRMHYEEAPQRAIRGIATMTEAEELLDEGISILPVLVPPERETH